MKNKYIIPILLVAAAGAFWWWNSKRIEALRLKLEMIKSQPQNLPSRTDLGGWRNIINILLDLGEDVYSQFRPGGAFYKGQETLGDLEIDEIVKSLA